MEKRDRNNKISIWHAFIRAATPIKRVLAGPTKQYSIPNKLNPQRKAKAKENRDDNT